MRNRYGANIAEAMLACCNTKLFLQTVDRETRVWASETIGDCEVEMRVATDALTTGKEIPRTSIATQRSFRAAVLESELRLKPHHGYLLLPDGLPVARIALTADHITRRGEPRHKGFVAGDPKGTLWSRVSEIARNAAPDAKTRPRLMVASISALSSSGQAASYYEADDYYTGDDMAPSAWEGQAAADLGPVGRGGPRRLSAPCSTAGLPASSSARSATG